MACHDLLHSRSSATPGYVLTSAPVCSLLRAFAAQAEQAAEAPPRSHGGLKDEDRIFTNLYGRGDPFLKVGTPLSLQALDS